MGGVIRARHAVIAGVIVLLAVQIGAFLRGDVTWRFFNAPEQGSVTGNFAMVPGGCARRRGGADARAARGGAGTWRGL